MKKIYALYFLLFLSAFNYVFSQPFLPFGSADVIDASANEYLLTPDLYKQTGAVWSQTPLDLTKCFKIQAQLNFGTADDSGADGIAFVISTQHTGTGTFGGSLGYAGISPALDVEFDDWDNFRDSGVNDPPQDHLAFMKNGNIYHTTPNYNILPDIETGVYLDATFSWDAISKTLTVNFLGSNYTYTEDIASTIFSGVSSVYFGFTAGTGDRKNLHRVKILSVQNYCPLSFNLIKKDNSCFGGNSGSATLTVTGGKPPYTYILNGSESAPINSTTINITGLAAANYTISVKDADGNVTPNQFFTITQPTAITATQTQTNVSCYGGNTGSATVTPAGGTPPYMYAWSPSGGAGATATGLSAGTYSVVITDAKGCNVTKSFTITQPTAITATQTQTNVSCYGGNTGSAMVTPAGGTPPYMYAWSPSGGAGATATGLSAGTYTVVITDNKGCNITKTFTITQPTAITATQTQTNVSCNGGNTGSATVTPAGGTPSYMYAWSPSGGTGATATGLSAGTYTVVITDAKGCNITKTFTITQPTAITATQTQTNVSCYGGNTGSATVTPSGGTPPYMYSWSPTGGNGATATGLSARTYSVVITDAKGCSITKTVTITQPSTAFNVTKETFPNQFNTGFTRSLVNKTFIGASGTWTANSNSNATIVVLQPYYSPSTSYALKIVNFKTRGCVGGGSGSAIATSPKVNLTGACCPTDVKMNFTLWTYTCTAGDTKASLGIDFSNDNGTTWNQVWSNTSSQLYSSYGDDGKTNVSIAIPAAYQNENFKYRFRGNMAADDAYNFYLFIDDIDISSCSSVPGSIGNFVWNDINGNGLQDASEPGIGGAVVKLTKPGGATTTTSTNSMGAYSFTNLPAGTYIVNFATPAGFVPTNSNQGNNDGLDSDPSNMAVSVTLAGNQNISTVDAGFTAHTYCKNNCSHKCNHSNCGDYHFSWFDIWNYIFNSLPSSNSSSYKGNTSTQSAVVSAPAVSTETPVSATTTNVSLVDKGKDVKLVSAANDQLKVTVLSNPTQYEFTLQINGKANQPITVRLVDWNGRVVNLFNNLQSNYTLKVGSNLMKGAYFAEVVQGEERKVVKLLKL